LWLKNPAQGEDEGDDPRGARRQSIVPVVEDTKNALLLKFDPVLDLDQRQMATLQQALVRAIETEHVLEAGELLGEPLPTQDQRKAILFYEAAEGGAGVLKRLMDGPQRWRKLAEVALDLMHYCFSDEGLQHQEDACVAGCYRCILSYYNQPDHALIDRRDDKVIDILLKLLQCEQDKPAEEARPTESERAWLSAFARWGLPAPSAEIIDGVHYSMVWPSHMMMAVIQQPSESLRQRCATMGRELVWLPPSPGDSPPGELAIAFWGNQ
ncbi:MAG: DUF1998 domain-containing protein, partial [Novosphingobium sp.]|nr:DUF1998 domain-containing protein [Novosphingobium sp.]